MFIDDVNYNADVNQITPSLLWTYTSNSNYFDIGMFSSYFSSPSSSCQCIKLRDCLPFVEVIRKSSPSEFRSVMESLRNKICGYEGSHVTVCCPSFDQRNRRENFHFDSTTDKPWIWDIEDTTTTIPSYQTINLNNRFNSIGGNSDFHNFLQPHRTEFGDPDSSFNEFHQNHFKRKTPRPFRRREFLFHFEDPTTHKNCPPAISNEFELPDNFKHVVPPVDINVPLPVIPVTTPPNEIDGNVSSGQDLTREEKMRLVNTEYCGISINTRIIGGEDAGPGQFPWMARLAYRNKTSGLVSYRCAGTVISDKYVVTASHCVTNLIDELELVLVRLGELDSKSSNICSTSGNTLCSESQDFEIENIVHHPNYDIPKYSNDIALIRLNRQSNASFISPLCLPMGNYAETDLDLVGRNGIVAGWGAISAGSTTPSPILQWLRIPFVNTSVCAASYAQFSANSRTPIIVGAGQVCVQGRANADACQGDSGGPLMSETTQGTDRYALLGIVSFGPRTCGVSNFPGVYTRVSSYIDWILDNMEV
ncbi:Phenoloxidase-activating factor 3 [Pseudolycoriella hygida]|uniref:CLIP domain-containing serine protease n=1 Tax=Pseudolycoriella hygida TaxID=35572 RepID=A0A9Q0MVE0_9DIPT|nr:Phenoloxidase-activating factor 3 [Pseudolycoriella hygida]